MEISAIKILRDVKRIDKLDDGKDKDMLVEKLCEFAYTYVIKDNLPKIFCCDKCGYVMTTLDSVCPSCGKLIDE